MRTFFYLLCALAICVGGCDDEDDGGASGAGGAGSGDTVTLNGAVNKGPFVTGSTVNVSPVGATGNPTGAVYSTQTLNDLGEFSVEFEYTGLVSLEGSGFYYNEAVGELSGANITLRAFYEVAAAGTQDAHINIITHLSYNRVKTLMTEGATFAAAVTQAEGELRDALGISPPDFDPGAAGTQMNISGGDNAANAYLLATSAVFAQAAMLRQLQGGSIDANLQELLNTFGSDLQADGALNEDKVAEIAAAMLTLDTGDVKTKLAARLNAIGSDAAVPDLDTVIDQDGDGQTNTEDCLPLDPTRWTGNADIDGDGHDSIYCGGDDCVDFAEGFHGADCLRTVNLLSIADIHRCAIQPSGRVLCVRDGVPSPTAPPSEIWYSPEGSRFISVVAIPNDEWTCGVRDDLSIQCWTSDGVAVDSFWDGVDGIPEGDFRIMDLSSGAVCGIDEQGVMRCWGQPGCDWQRNDPGEPMQPFSPLPEGPYSDVAVGHCIICGIAADQSIQCWPQDGLSANDRLVPPDGQFTSLSMSNNGVHMCAVAADQSVGCWVPSGPTATPDGQFTFVSAGGEWGPMTFACGVHVDGSVACWDNTNGELDLPTGSFLQVAVGDRTACGMRTNGGVACWHLAVGEIPQDPPPGPGGDGGVGNDGGNGDNDGGVGPAGPGPNCPDDEMGQNEAVCRYLAECALSECAYQGDRCRASLMGDCLMTAGGEVGVILRQFGCAATDCQQILDPFSRVTPALRRACMEGAPVDRCGGGMPGDAGVDRDAGVDDGGVPEPRTCTGLSECIANCDPDGPCIEDCQSRSTDRARAALRAVTNCMGAHHGCQGNECVEDCAAEVRACRENADIEPGPNCPQMGELGQNRAVCLYLADCAISECAYDGDRCRASVYQDCLMAAGGAFGQALRQVGCMAMECGPALAPFRGTHPDFNQACMEGAPVNRCDGMDPEPDDGGVGERGDGGVEDAGPDAPPEPLECPPDDEEAQNEAVCRHLVDCVIFECAYEGDVCRASVYQDCMRVARSPIVGGNLRRIGCSGGPCGALIEPLSQTYPALQQACMEGAPVDRCEEMDMPNP